MSAARDGWDLTMPLGDGYELASLRAELNPHGVGVLYNPWDQRWIAVWGARGYAEAATADELRSQVMFG